MTGGALSNGEKRLKKPKNIRPKNKMHAKEMIAIWTENIAFVFTLFSILIKKKLTIFIYISIYIKVLKLTVFNGNKKEYTKL